MTTSRSRAAHTGANEGVGSDPALAGSARRTSASAPSEMFRQLLPNDVCMRRLQLADADRHGVRDRGFCLGEATRPEFATPRTVAEDGKQSVHRLGDTRRATQSIRREGAPTAFRDRTQRPEKKTVATAS